MQWRLGGNAPAMLQHRFDSQLVDSNYKHWCLMLRFEQGGKAWRVELKGLGGHTKASKVEV